MKFWIVLTLVSFCLSLNAPISAQAIKEGDQDYSRFLIDTTKPYVYLEVDHVGTRTPLRNDEPKSGIWLHLKNNCKLPIVVLAVGTPLASSNAIILEDEIVPNPQASGGGEDARMAGLAIPSGLKDAQDITDIFRWPNRTEEEVRRAEEAQRATSKPIERPLGYGSQNGFNSFVLTLIAPGEQLYFSVPANHVSKSWHFEIPFRLAVPNNSRIRPPYSYLAFYQEDLDRAQEKVPAPTTR
jgi:hypothetical protein